MDRRLLLVALVGSVAACAELPVLEPNTCGNGVREGGEDCDLFADSALGDSLTCGAQCRYVCDPEDPLPACPAGWACGDDGVCRFGASAFEASADSPLLFPASRLLLGDIDADGKTDVVGGNAAAIEVRFGGGPDGSLREPFAQRAEFPIAPRALAHVGAGAQLDLLAPTPAGVDVYFGDDARRLVPAGFASLLEASLVPEGVGPARLVPLRAPGKLVDDVLAVFVDAAGRLSMSLVPLDGAAPAAPTTLGAAPGPAAAALEPVRVGDRDVLAVSAEGAGEVHLVALTCASAPDCAGVELRPVAWATVDMPAATTIAAGARLVDIDGDGVLDVLASVALPVRGRALALALGRADGTFDRADTQRLGALCDDADECWPLAVGDLQGDGSAELVLPTGVWTTTGSVARTPRLVHPQLERQTAAEILDLDGDGRLDVVMVSGSVLQVLVNAGGLFNGATFDVGRAVRLLSHGDFDGDGVEDVAIVQDTRADSYGAPLDLSDVSVLFGARSGGARAPELMGRFFRIDRVAAGELPSRSFFGDDAISDLVVQVIDPEGRRRAGLMSGTGQRRLHAPLTLPVLERSPTSLPAAVLGVDVDQDGGRDLLAFTYAELAGGPGAGPFVYLLQDLGGAYDLDAILGFGPDSSCLTETALGRGCMQVAAGELGDLGGALVVNQRAGCLSPVPETPLELTLLRPAGGALACHALAAGGAAAWADPAAPRFADLEADGRPEVLVLFRGDDAPGTRGLAIWDAVDGAPALLALPDALDVVAVAPINADGDPELEIAVLARDGVYLVERDDGGLVWPSSPIIPLAFGADAALDLAVADLDGDGLRDILVGSEDRLSIYRSRQAWLGGPPPEE